MLYLTIIWRAVDVQYISGAPGGLFLNRRSGILMHISSLPGRAAIGTLGPEAEQFADFLCSAGFSLWQVLPLTPVSSVCGNSPYSSCSAFAGNRMLISGELLVSEGLCDADEFICRESCSKSDYQCAEADIDKLLASAWEKINTDAGSFIDLKKEFHLFMEEESFWLNDYTLFILLKEKFQGRCWNEWSYEYRSRNAEALACFASDGENAARLNYLFFVQFIFYRQWRRLRAYCADRGISFIGDMPLYVALDSADVWAHQALFELDGEGAPQSVAGVPPDYFSKTGQRWGNPLYLWDEMEADDFYWWRQRFYSAVKNYDIVRVDHFRGFCAYWAIPAEERTAVNGAWRGAPGAKLLNTLKRNFFAADGKMPLIAEDLGIITDDVCRLMNEFSLPGMKVLMFAFGDDVGKNPYAPHNICRNSVVYTGTHDNNTVLGWWEKEATARMRLRFKRYIGSDIFEHEAAERMVALALASAADIAVVAMQDIMGLDSTARMNVPGVPLGNWEWRAAKRDFASMTAAESITVLKYRELNNIYGRLNKDCPRREN